MIHSHQANLILLKLCRNPRKRIMKFLGAVHPDLIIAQKYAYAPIGLLYKQLVIEKEGQEYGACEFLLNNHIVKFRTSKITPTKNGQFVTFWKRIESWPILPYDVQDRFDALIISVRCSERLGQFVFPKSVLLKHGIISGNKKSGKRAIRVYPPWDIANNPQAKNTQSWQLQYFFEIQPKMHAIDHIKQLFS